MPRDTPGRRQAILDAALRCLERAGVDGLTVQALSEESGASVGSLYHHFGSLGGVFGSLYQAGLISYREVLIAALHEAPSARDKVEATVRTYLRWCEEHPAWARFLLKGRGHPGVRANEAAIRDETRMFGKQVFELFRPHVKAGEIERLPGEVYGPLLTGPAEELIRHWLAGRNERPPTHYADLLARLAWKSLRVSDDGES
ncbi:TetR/AcrR family transcriptional regulator [Nannocystaceae bacterium ST9]